MSDNLEYLYKSFGYLRFGIFPLVIWYLIENKKNFLRDLFYIFLFCFFILSLDAAREFFSGINILGHQKLTYRVSSFFGDELILGSYLSRLLPIFLALLLMFHDKLKIFQKYKTFKISGLILISSFAIIVSGERIAIFFLFSLVILSFFLLDFQIKYKLICLSFFIFASLFVVNTSHTLKTRIIDSTKAQIGLKNELLLSYGIKKNNNTKYIFSEVHQSHFETAYNMFRIHPFLGVGPKNYRNFCMRDHIYVNKYSCVTHPHNTLIQLMAETGILGALFIITLNIFIYYICIKDFFLKFFKKKKLLSNFDVLLIISIINSIFLFIPSGSFFNNFLSIIYYFPIGIILWSFNKKSIIKF